FRISTRMFIHSGDLANSRACSQDSTALAKPCRCKDSLKGLPASTNQLVALSLVVILRYEPAQQVSSSWNSSEKRFVYPLLSLLGGEGSGVRGGRRILWRVAGRQDFDCCGHSDAVSGRLLSCLPRSKTWLADTIPHPQPLSPCGRGERMFGRSPHLA